MRFRDRSHAGQLLTERLGGYVNSPDVLVLALPRGGVPVGYEVAKGLNVPLDIVVVRKLGLPGDEELAMGAIASGEVRVLNPDVIQWSQVSNAAIDQVTAREVVELRRRDRIYRGAMPPLEVAGKTVILVDDGIATGCSMRAAVAVMRVRHPMRIVIAVPTAPSSSMKELGREVDDFVALISPVEFVGVGQWYEDFSQVSDEETRELYDRAKRRLAGINAAKKNAAAA